jgi:hypothetical protein
MPERAAFPAPGTKCADCGRCQADVFAGEDALCFACDAGETCAAKKAAARAPAARVEKAHTRVASAGVTAARALRNRKPKSSPNPQEAATMVSHFPDLRSRFDHDEPEEATSAANAPEPDPGDPRGIPFDVGFHFTNIPAAPEGVIARELEALPAPAQNLGPCQSHHVVQLRVPAVGFDRLLREFTAEEKIIALEAVLQHRVNRMLDDSPATEIASS